MVALGARFDDRVTGKLDSFAPNAVIVHADIDPAEIGKNRAVDVPITDDPAGHGTQDVVLFLVKTYDTAAAAELARPLVGDATAVATLQNGIGGADVLAAAYGADRVLAGVTYQGATVLAPGQFGCTWLFSCRQDGRARESKMTWTAF